MTAFASVTLQNNAAANIVFTPSKIDAEGVALWYSTATVLDGRPRCSLKVVSPVGNSSVGRVTGRVAVPIMDTVDTSKKIGECLGTFEFVMPKVATETQRLDIRKMLDTLVLHAATTAAVQYLESQY
jgi:hypothetical protein